MEVKEAFTVINDFYEIYDFYEILLKPSKTGFK